MTDTLAGILMGIVEGVTEFLPISSTGHLILAGNLLGFDARYGKDVTTTFEIVIQLGAILALFVAYPGRFAQLLNPGAKGGFAGFRGLGLLVLSTVPPGLAGLALQKAIKAHLFSAYTVAIGFAVGAIWILLVERLCRGQRKEGLDQVTWRDALGVGLFQCCGLWPGMSRSGSTILGGMLLGLQRKTATEYSFFAGVPLLGAATVFEFLKALKKHELNATHIPLFAVAFVVSFVAAWVTVKLFIRFLSRNTLEPFAWYRLAMAAVIFWNPGWFMSAD